MLKITVNDETEAVRIRLEGRLTGPWVSELERCWCTVCPSVRQRHLVLDLTDLEFVDAAGKYLLALMQSRGAEFAACTMTMRDLVEEITGRPQSDRN